MNDLIPFFARDLTGCMRWTAVFSIEMKFFVGLPFIVYFYHRGNELIATSFCLLIIVVGNFSYGFVLYNNKIAPGYLHQLDYEASDLVRFKPWTHMDSYASGIFLAFIYREIID